MEDKKYNSHITFEEIVKQNERRIYYQLHKLNIRDPHQEFYQEGLVAMWNAYETYQPDKGPMATYFNYTIRNRLIDLIRKKGRNRNG
ncbi:sigma-70 family RNA polymerase sigma factor [Virgibacillus pantothenticus]|uniref:sigma-70 family RNA polymerase sigma factor n=1 Tax=Virgibacillus pantothenticus TaxID=1473 RepID=UPI0025AFD480|nr:sigma-70 family RNA polymerase sigma factor [Virgibacillus pantothenticus]